MLDLLLISNLIMRIKDVGGYLYHLSGGGVKDSEVRHFES